MIFKPFSLFQKLSTTAPHILAFGATSWVTKNLRLEKTRLRKMILAQILAAGMQRSTLMSIHCAFCGAVAKSRSEYTASDVESGKILRGERNVDSTQAQNLTLLLESSSIELLSVIYRARQPHASIGEVAQTRRREFQCWLASICLREPRNNSRAAMKSCSKFFPDNSCICGEPRHLFPSLWQTQKMT